MKEKCPECHGKGFVSTLDIMHGRNIKKRCTVCIGSGKVIKAKEDEINTKIIDGVMMLWFFDSKKTRVISAIVMMRKMEVFGKKKVLSLMGPEKETAYPAMIHAMSAHPSCPDHIIKLMIEKIKNYFRMVMIDQKCPFIEPRLMQMLRDAGLTPRNDCFSWIHPEGASFDKRITDAKVDEKSTEEVSKEEGPQGEES